jgi:hypothetical protein
VKHGGGKLLRQNSPDYNTLLAWIRAGAKLDTENERRIVSLRVLPAGSVLSGRNATRKLLVVAHYSDGMERDVTRAVKFQSNDDSIAKVSAAGSGRSVEQFHRRRGIRQAQSSADSAFAVSG